jgi:tRNA-intron endonuclease
LGEETARSTPGRLPHAELLPDLSAKVRDPTEASLLHGRGYYGEMGEEGSLKLDPRETAYLREMDRISLSGPGNPELAFPDLVKQAQQLDPTFDILYLVYRDLRQRGYVVRSGPPPFPFSLLPRGGTLGKTPSRFFVSAFSERTPFSLPALRERLDACRGAKRGLLLGVVDEESDLTFYRAREVEPRGTHQPPPLPSPVEAWFFGDRVSLLSPTEPPGLPVGEGYGSRVGQRLELSLLEAWYLAEEGRLRFRDPDGTDLAPSVFQHRALAIEPDLPLRLPVYRHLRSVGLLPKTGFKYGAHFRAYERAPESSHARYLVHVVPPDWATPWPEVARAIRLAQGVRKQFLLAEQSGGGTPRYVHLERTRP